MKWFKHLTASRTDPDIGAIIDRFGYKGYFLFFRTLEIMSDEFSIESPAKNEFNFKWFLDQFPRNIDKKTLIKFYDFCQNSLEKKRIIYSINGKYIAVKFPKLKDLTDDYTSRALRSTSEVNPNNVRSKSEKNPSHRNKNKEVRIKNKEKIEEVIHHLNEKTGKQFSPKSKTNIDFINGRLAEGRTLQDFYHVIDVKVAKWGGDPKMQDFLRPSTLFRPTNFENYLQENIPKQVGGSNYVPSKKDADRQSTLAAHRKKLVAKHKPQIDKAKKARDQDALQAIEDTIQAEVARKSREI